MPKEDGVRERLGLLHKECGSFKAMSRWSGLSDVSLRRWIELDFPPLRSKLAQLSENTGVSLDWILHGRGDEKAELAKVKTIPASDAKAPRVHESPSTIPEVVRYITEHGDEEDVKMVEEILTAAQRRIRDRKTGGGHVPRRTKYA